jgi:hypothetical protein
VEAREMKMKMNVGGGKRKMEMMRISFKEASTEDVKGMSIGFARNRIWESNRHILTISP